MDEKLKLENITDLHQADRESLAATAHSVNATGNQAKFWSDLRDAVRAGNLSAALDITALTDDELKSVAFVACGFRDRLAHEDPARAAFWADVAAGLDEEHVRR